MLFGCTDGSYSVFLSPRGCCWEVALGMDWKMQLWSSAFPECSQADVYSWLDSPVPYGTGSLYTLSELTDVFIL